MTPQDRMREYNQLRYARRLVSDKDKWMPDFELRVRIYGREWGETIWNLCRAIKRGER